MTDPNGAAPTNSGSADLETYIRENRDAFTEDALRRQALAAGHPHDAVEAALTATRTAEVPVDRGRVVRNVFLVYLAVYLILDVLMLINPAIQTSGYMRGIGIIVLSIGLGAAFIASLVWIASRRLFIGLVGLGIAIFSIFSLSSAGVVDIVAPLGLAALGVGLAVAAARLGRTGAPASPSIQLLLVVPVLLLLAVGGTCVISGLPIPRPV